MSSTLAALTECIAPQMAAVDARFREELVSDLACVNALVRHVSRFHGKMLRPMLVLLSGKACGAELSDAHVTIATVVEMVHMATLVHDDVLDEAELRRKGATCCLLGATLAGGSPGQVAALQTYGLALGVAFQIQDDILDLIGDAGTVGKTLGIDIEKQKMTLAIIHFLRTAPVEHRALMRSL